jgi:hypothetical protein
VIEHLHMIISLQGSSLGVLSHGDSLDDLMLDIPQCLSFLNHLNTVISLSFHLLSHRGIESLPMIISLYRSSLGLLVMLGHGDGSEDLARDVSQYL